MLFIACQTANHDSKSLLHAATLAGVECAVGFTVDINAGKADTWNESFFKHMREGLFGDEYYDTVAECCAAACAESDIPISVLSIIYR